jgi:hypothetical protein
MNIESKSLLFAPSIQIQGMLIFFAIHHNATTGHFRKPRAFLSALIPKGEVVETRKTDQR